MGPDEFCGRPPPERVNRPVIDACGILSGRTLRPGMIYGKLMPYCARPSRSTPSLTYGSSCARSAAPDTVKSLILFDDSVVLIENAPSLLGRYQRVLERSSPVPKVPSN